MKRMLFVIATFLALAAFVAACSSKNSGAGATSTPTAGGGTAQTSTPSPTGTATSISSPSATATSSTSPSATASASTTSLPIATVLTQAIDQSYKNHALYQAVVDKFGRVAPFANILVSEQAQIAALKLLFSANGLTAPADTALGNVSAPGTFHAACQAGVAAEQETITLYTGLIAETTDARVLTVLNQHLGVSQHNHLPAFQSC